MFEHISEIINKVYDEINLNERDIFNRLREIGLIKFKIMKKFPQAFNFLKNANNEEASEVKSEIDKIRRNITQKGFQKIYENIDFTRFRDDIDIEKTLNIINWTMLSFSEQQVNKLNSFQDIDIELLKEWDGYFDIMKRCFYKKEED